MGEGRKCEGLPQPGPRIAERGYLVAGLAIMGRSAPIQEAPKFRFNLGSIKRLKKSGFGPYATPPKRLRFFETMVRDQEDGGSNPLAPTICFGINNLQPCEEAWSAWS